MISISGTVAFAIGSDTTASILVRQPDSSQTIQQYDSASGKLSPDATAYVTVPSDGRYGPTVYNGSGETTAQIVTAAFAPHLVHVERAGSIQTREDALIEARNIGADYLVEVAILHWEDRATEWSGISDKVKVQISVLNSKDGKVLDKAVIDGKSSYWTLGGDHPQDLLPRPVAEYIAGLF